MAQSAIRKLGVLALNSLFLGRTWYVSLVHKLSSALILSQGFEFRFKPEQVQGVEFEEKDKLKQPRTITGQEEKIYVYWDNCNVTVYENDTQGQQQLNSLKEFSKGTWRGALELGSKLYMVGGSVRTESEEIALPKDSSTGD